MDLIPGASLLNKSPHRLTFDVKAKLNRQVQDFLEKYMIRESFTPCAVPIILAPKKNEECRMCTTSRTIKKIIEQIELNKGLISL